MKVRIPAIIRRDFLRKLVALFFAILIWFTITNQLREFESYHDIPITLRYPPDKLVLNQRIFTADVMLRGSRSRLEEVKSSDIKITAEVEVVPEGVYYHDLHLGPDNVSTPPGTRVAQIDPANIRIQLDRIVSKQVPVKVREAGELAYGYRVVKQSVIPSTVTISGPSKIVRDIDRIMTESVVLDEAVVRSFEMENVDLIPISGVDVNPETVHVAYEIDKHSGQQAFADLQIGVLNRPGSNLRLKGELPPAAVTVRGPRLALEEIKPHNIHPFIDISTITAPGRYNPAVQVWIDRGPRVGTEYIHPENVSIEVVAASPSAPANGVSADAEDEPIEPPGTNEPDAGDE